MGQLWDNLYKMMDRCRMRSEFEGFEEFEEFDSLKGWGSVPRSALWEQEASATRITLAIDFSDGFVIRKNRILNEAVTW